MSKTVSYAQWSLEPYCIGLKLRSLRTENGSRFPAWPARRGFPPRCSPSSKPIA